MNDQKHLFIATPSHDGKVSAKYAESLAKTVSLLNSFGVKVTTLIEENGTLLVAARNRLIEYFWDSDASHILCIDSDLGWNSQSVLNMLNSDKEFMGGVYPSRKIDGYTFKPQKNDDESLVTNDGFIKSECIPAGFMLIKRSAIKKMRRSFPQLYYSPKDNRDQSESAYMFFNTELIDGEFWGEDYVFCKRATAAGIDIWVDPTIKFNHNGTIGALTDILTPVSQNKQHTQES